MALERDSARSSVIDVLDRVLDKGIVIDASIRVAVAGIELVGIEARVVVASVETYLRHADAVAFTALAARPRSKDDPTPEPERSLLSTPSHERRSADRRGAERRVGADRRVSNRRQRTGRRLENRRRADVLVSVERRSGSERRSPRRRAIERRLSERRAPGGERRSGRDRRSA